MNWQLVSTLVRKDITLYFRNRFFAFVSILGIGAYAAIYFIMPDSVDETLTFGLYAPTIPPIFEELMEEEGVIIEIAESEKALKEAMLEGEYSVGVVFPAGLMERLSVGEKDRILLYLTSDFPKELEEAYIILFQELVFAMTGQTIPIDASEEILGPDMAGTQIPTRARMLPLFAVFILMVETLGLASLIASEVEMGTLQALLVTPLNVRTLFLGKGITGVSLALGQVAALALFTGGLREEPLLVLTALLLGSVLVTGIGFMIASAGRDMLSVMAWGILAILILVVPSFAVLFPGTGSAWSKLIPSYYLVDTVHRAANFGLAWSDAWGNLAILLGFDVLIIWLGILALRRKFQ